MRSYVIPFALGVAVLGAQPLGCSPSASEVAPDKRVTEREPTLHELFRARWESDRPASYTFVWARSCECLPDFVKSIRVGVTGDAITRATYVHGGGDVAGAARDTLLTIDGLLDTIREAVEGGADDVRVEYAPLGSRHPVSIFIDYDELVADDELILEISEFMPGD